MALFIGDSVRNTIEIWSDNLNHVSPVTIYLSVMIPYQNGLPDPSEFVSGHGHVVEFIITGAR